MGKPPFRSGDKIKDYCIGQEFMVGPLGVVYTIRGKPYLLKAPLLEINKNIEKFCAAVTLLQSISHPNIQHIIDSDLTSNIPWIVVEQKTNTTLRQMMKKGGISILDATRWMFKIASALGFTHTKQPNPLLHRQLRPEFIGFKNQMPMVLDFGLIEFGSTSGEAISNEANILYLAPELFDIRNKLDSKAEVYALGVIYYELLAGRLPYGAIDQVDDEESRMKIIEQITNPQYPIPPITDLPKPLPRILQKSLYRDRQHRYAHAEALATDIKTALKDMLIAEAHKCEERDDLGAALTLLEEATPLVGDPNLSQEVRFKLRNQQRAFLEKSQIHAQNFRSGLQNFLQLLQSACIDEDTRQSLIRQIVSLQSIGAAAPNAQEWRKFLNELQDLQKIVMPCAPQEVQTTFMPKRENDLFKMSALSEAINSISPAQQEAMAVIAVEDKVSGTIASLAKQPVTTESPTIIIKQPITTPSLSNVSEAVKPSNSSSSNSSSTSISKLSEAVKQPTTDAETRKYVSGHEPAEQVTVIPIKLPTLKPTGGSHIAPTPDIKSIPSYLTDSEKPNSSLPEDNTRVSDDTKPSETLRRADVNKILGIANLGEVGQVSEIRVLQTEKNLPTDSSQPIVLPKISSPEVAKSTTEAPKPNEVIIKRVIKSDAPDKSSKTGKDEYGPKVIAEETSPEEDAPTLILKSVDDDGPKVLQRGTETINSSPSEEYETWIAEGEKPSNNDNEPMPRPNLVLPHGFNWIDDQRILCEKDGGEMIYIPAGTFIMGSEAIHAFEVEKPEHEVYLDDFFMDIYPITWKQYLKYCDETNHIRPPAPEWGMPEDHPVVNVTWQEAQDYCKWAGKSLPTEAQWEKAARGGLWLDGDRRKHKRNQKPRRTYPWGDDSPNADGIWRSNYNAEPRFGKNRGSKSTSPINTFPIGKSPYGIMDLAGNVWEWASDWFSKDYYKRSPRHNPFGPDVPDQDNVGGEEDDAPGRVLRGGSWYIGSRLLRVTARRKRPSEGQGASCGMRCVLIIP